MIDAIVGNRSGGLTPVADHVTAPSLMSLVNVGMAAPFNESWLNPSSTKRMTCSVGGLAGLLLSIAVGRMVADALTAIARNRPVARAEVRRHGALNGALIDCFSR